MKNFKFWILFCIFPFLYTLGLRAQDLFDSLNTAKYADFLFLSANYSEAIEEYERLVFTYQADETLKLRLVKSYRLAGDPILASKRMKMLWSSPDTESQKVARELFTLRVVNKDFHNLDQAVVQNTFLSREEKYFFTVSSALLQDDFIKADTLLTASVPFSSNALLAFKSITEDALSQSYKSPLLAGLMSAAIPGSGKIYAGNWADGLLAMSIVGVSAWQAYRGFEKRGTESVYGWLYSAIGGAFYIGNIYGSIKETNRYNHIKKSRIRIRVEATFYNNL